MQIPAKAQYALKAILELSKHWPQAEPLVINSIAIKQGIPLKFLTQILLTLKQHGLVVSVRGKQGGYLLTRAPEKILISQVLGVYMSFEIKGKGIFYELINEVSQKAYNDFNKISFQDILKREQATNKVPFYNI